MIVEHLRDAVFHVDRFLKVLYMNRAAEQFVGKHRSVCLGRTLQEVWDEFPAEVAARLVSDPTGNLTSEIDGQPDRGSLLLEAIPAAEDTLVLHVREFDQQRLEARQEFIPAVLDSVESAIVACDEKGILQFFNRAARKLHGVDRQELAPDQWAQRYSLRYPDSREVMRKEDVPLYRALAGEHLRDAEIVVISADGQPRTLLCSGRPLYSQDGRKLGAVVAMHDVTHRRLASRRVRAALRQFRQLFNDAPVGYHEIDTNGIIRRVNRAECRLLGRTKEEVIGQPAWNFVAESEREQSRQAVIAKLAGTRPLRVFQRDYERGDGSRVTLEVHENIITGENGQIAGIRTALLDMTDRRARKEAEATSAETLSILERIGDAYMTFDTEWRYTYVNRKAAEFARRPAEELIGRRVWDVFPDAIETRFYTELQKAMRTQQPVEFENYFPPLETWFENSVYPSSSGVAVFYRDITERKRTQQSLEIRTAELARKNADLETFAYVASHDLQEPLRTIGSFTRLLARRYQGSLDAEADEFISYTLDGVERMQRMIKDLLRLSRVGSPDPARIVQVDAGAVLAFVRSHLSELVEETGATLISDTLPSVRFVETHLIQVFQNLIANAIRYRREVPPMIEVSAVHQGQSWRFAVRDNGRGFGAYEADLIFRPFKRLDATDDGGSGIGLAICRKIVESHGGRIWAESQPGVGSVFYFTVPDEQIAP